MKKTFTILSISIITLFSINANAQDAKEYVKSYIGILAGVSIPESNFGQYIYSNNSAGFAKKGVTLGLDGAYYFYKNFAIGATFSFQDQGELSSDDVQNLANGYRADFQRDQTTVIAVNRYHNFNLMAGPQYSFAWKKLTLDLRASAGLIKSTSTPSLNITYESLSNTTVTLQQLSSEAKAFAYGGSAGLRYSIGDKWCLNLRGNYINSDGIKIGNTNNPGTTGRFVTKQPITEFQTTLGITLNISK